MLSSRAASTMNGPWIAQCPPAEGAKKLMINELITPQKGKLWVVEMLMNAAEMVSTNPDACIIAMIPA
ncbi:hypothetical protein D3C76_921310 [compost metagenome]